MVQGSVAGAQGARGRAREVGKGWIMQDFVGYGEKLGFYSK